MTRKSAAKAVQAKESAPSGAIASGTVQRRARKTHAQVHDEGYDAGVRHCIEALLTDGNDRQYIAEVFETGEIPFPFTVESGWQGLFAFEDWDDWVEADAT